MDEEKQEALRLLAGLEDGGLTTTEASVVAESLDPVFLHVIVRFLRECYPASHPAATGVLTRVVNLTTSDPAFVRKSKVGEGDPITQWFEGEYSYGDFRGRGADLIQIIAEKIDS